MPRPGAFVSWQQAFSMPAVASFENPFWHWKLLPHVCQKLPLYTLLTHINHYSKCLCLFQHGTLTGATMGLHALTLVLSLITSTTVGVCVDVCVCEAQKVEGALRGPTGEKNKCIIKTFAYLQSFRQASWSIWKISERWWPKYVCRYAWTHYYCIFSNQLCNEIG